MKFNLFLFSSHISYPELSFTLPISCPIYPLPHFYSSVSIQKQAGILCIFKSQNYINKTSFKFLKTT